LLECALQVYWKFGWIYSHLVKSRVKNSSSRQTLWYVSVFPLHSDSDIKLLPVGVCMVILVSSASRNFFGTS